MWFTVLISLIKNAFRFSFGIANRFYTFVQMLNSLKSFKEKALTYASTFDSCCFLDSNLYNDQYGKYQVLIAFGEEEICQANAGNAFDSLKQFSNTHQDWMFGLLGYDLKNEIEEFEQKKTDKLDFPDLFFFIPKHLIAIQNNEIHVIKGSPEILQKINNFELAIEKPDTNIELKAKFSKAEYEQTVEKIKTHIRKGDIYEMNFCQEFYAEHLTINPLNLYQTLNQLSPSPFSGFMKIRDKFILSASPERFLTKKNDIIVSQPIKGTAKRGKNEAEDLTIKMELKNSLKEQSENVMVVDLVRNDLAKSAKKGTVNVDELFGIYTFPQVHQMISTISCELSSFVHFVDAIKNTFPMGSMTGAPKLSVMQLIDKYEKSKRGAYSGAMGYINPKQDFDFNVLIRSILYNKSKKYLSFQVGGAITYQSDAKSEYEECLLKASAMLQVLQF